MTQGDVMSDSLQVRVCLVHNPWSGVISDTSLMEVLLTAAQTARVKLETWIAEGDVEEDRNSFGAVLLDPTRKRGENYDITERIYALIMIGPKAESYLPNGAAKADAHDRHGVMNGLLVDDDIHCLAAGEFGWGNSAEYRRAIGGGSGLSVEQDAEMVKTMLRVSIDDISSMIRSWLDEQRTLKPGKGHRWLSPDDTPAQEYAEVVDLLKMETAQIAVAD